MSANNNTKFPSHRITYNPNFSGTMIDPYALTKIEVMDWLKRMMEDFPERRDSTFMEEDFWEIDQWFDRWLSQFRNKNHSRADPV